MSTVVDLANQIIREQENIIGPVAWEEAQKVQGLKVNVQNHEVHVEGNPRDTLEGLVSRYERIFGRASREVCRDAVRQLVTQVPQDEVPSVLR